jgi:hypothetical protein
MLNVPPARLVQHLHVAVPIVNCRFPPPWRFHVVAAVALAVMRDELERDHSWPDKPAG